MSISFTSYSVIHRGLLDLSCLPHLEGVSLISPSPSFGPKSPYKLILYEHENGIVEHFFMVKMENIKVHF